jgi:ParB/RepB/Spo0J family partition protein
MKKHVVADADQNTAGTTLIPVDALVPNPWNPNRMSGKAFKEYVEEVRHVGAIPKPIICRPAGAQYEIIDGEHAWGAAKEIGLKKVPCQVLHGADDFEAMRQTYKRNRGGKDDPVQLGRMFQQMMRSPKLSARAFAKKINVSEATVRNYLNYAEAANVRTRFAGEDRSTEIAKLTKRELAMYQQLHDAIKNKWLDSENPLHDLEWICNGDVAQAIGKISAADLEGLVESTAVGFRRSIIYLRDLAEWRAAHRKIELVNDYVSPVAELHLPVGLLDELPCKTANDQATVLLSPEEWKTILTNIPGRTTNPKGQLALVQAAVRVALRNAGVDLESVYGPATAEAVQIVEAAPDFIQNAAHLTLAEKVELATISSHALPDAERQAKQLVVEYLGQQRGGKKGQRSTQWGTTIAEVFSRCLQQVAHDQRLAKEDQLFSDPERLLKAVLGKLAAARAITAGCVGEDSAVDVLTERLSSLAYPEFALLATYVLRDPDRVVDDAAARWMEAAAESASETCSTP